MSARRAVVGIDPSGNRLALVALKAGLGGPSPVVPPAVSPLRSERDALLLEDAEAALSDFVARHELAGSPARLCVPARHVYTAHVVFPHLKERDLRQALELELERLFPLPAARLRFAWRAAGEARENRRVRLAVAATPSDYLDRWEECVSRAGLVLAGAVPAGWAVSSACEALGHAPAAGGLTAVLRAAGGLAECTVLSGGEPVFSAARVCAPEAVPAEAAALVEEGVPDTAGPPEDGGDAPAELLAPSAWLADPAFRVAGDGIAWRGNDGFEADARKALAAAEPIGDPWELLGAFGAAAGARTMDLMAATGPGERFPWARTAAAALGAVAVLLALAWPAAIAWRTKAELSRLDARIAALQPSVATVQDSLDDMDDVESRIAALGEAGAGRGEPIEIVGTLTERLPTSTWLTGLRVENRKVEIDGLSAAASEIFPILARDGRFRGVEFAAPIIRQGDNLERFQIRAEYVSPLRQESGSGGAR